MKKKVIIAVISALGIVALSFGILKSNASEGSPKLSMDEITQLVSSQYPGTIEEIELETDFNKAVYEVEVISNGKKYELKLDGNTGEVLNLKERTFTKEEKDKLVLDDDNKVETNEENQSNNDQETKEPTKDQSEDNVDKNNQSTQQKSVIDARKAIEIAKSQFEGIFTDLEFKTDDGRLIYEVELLSGKDEAEIEIDAYTGEILVIEMDMKHNHKHKNIHKQHHKSGNKSYDIDALLSPEKVINIIEEHTDGIIKEIELDEEDGRLIYEVEAISGNQEVEMDIDAFTGKVLSIEIDD